MALDGKVATGDDQQWKLAVEAAITALRVQVSANASRK